MIPSRKFMSAAALIVFWVTGPALYAIEADLTNVLTAERLKPKGEYYDATVPDTLDLAERAKLSVHGLTSFLNPNQNYAPYGQGWFNVRVPYLTSKLIGGSDSGAPNWGVSAPLSVCNDVASSTNLAIPTSAIFQRPSSSR